MKARSATAWALAAAAAATVASLAAPAAGRDIKVINTAQPDATSIESLVASLTAGCTGDQDKMIALWAYLTRNDFYHWAEPREGPEPTTELGVVIDPIAAVNVHGMLICYQVCHVLANLAEAAGIPARTRSVPGHQLMEAFYDGKWHLFDATVDCQAYYVADDGKTVIGLDELGANGPKYLNDPKFPSRPFYQFDRFGGKFWPWESRKFCLEKFYNPQAAKAYNTFAPCIARGHRIQLDLRRGETLIRRFTNEGKWHCTPELYARWKNDPTQRWIDQGPHDPRRPGVTYANGELIYAPDWSAEANYLDGVYDSRNVALTGGRAALAGAGAGHVTFRVQTPYLIAGNPGKLDAAGDSSDGAIVEARFFRKDVSAANAIDISTDNGITWKRVWSDDGTGERAVRLDLTNHVEGRYGYLLKVSLGGDAGGDAWLAGLRMRHSLFLSPVPLPAVRAGANTFTCSVDEPADLVVIRPDLSDAQAHKRFFQEIAGLRYSPNYPEHLQPAGAEGHAVIEIAPPPGSKVSHVTVHGSFSASTSAAGQEKAEILYATAPEGPWRRVWASQFNQTNQKWRWDRSVDFDVQPVAERCYVKFHLRKQRRLTLNMTRIHARCVRASRPLAAGQVTVTHTWTGGGDGPETAQRVPIDFTGGPTTYTFNVPGTDIRNRAISIEVANDKP